MFKMKKLASIAAAAAMTGLVSTASAAEEVNMMFLPGAETNAVNFESGTGGGAKEHDGDSVEIDFKGNKYNTYKVDYLGTNRGIPTLTVNDLSAGTYSLYYIGGNGFDNDHSIENIKFIENDVEITPHIKKADIEKFDGVHYAHGYQITFDEGFSGTIKFVSTNTWLPDLYGIYLTNNNSFDFGTTTYDDNSVKLSVGTNSIALSGTNGEIKTNSDGSKETNNLEVGGESKKALLTYPDIDLTGKRLTKADISVGTCKPVTIELKVGDTVIGKELSYNNNDWYSGNLAFGGLNLENLKGNVTVDITKNGGDNDYCGNYRTITFYYKDIETPEPAKPSCTYSIDVPTETVDEESATGVGAAIKLNGSSVKTLKWTINKGGQPMAATFDDASVLSGEADFVIGLVVPMAIDNETEAAQKIAFSAE